MKHSKFSTADEMMKVLFDKIVIIQMSDVSLSLNIRALQVFSFKSGYASGADIFANTV